MRPGLKAQNWPPEAREQRHLNAQRRCPTELPALGCSSLARSCTRLVLPKPSTISGPRLPAEFQRLSLALGSRGRCEPRTLNLGPELASSTIFPSFLPQERSHLGQFFQSSLPSFLNSWVSILWEGITPHYPSSSTSISLLPHLEPRGLPPSI